jgi:hypothetical protein
MIYSRKDPSYALTNRQRPKTHRDLLTKQRVAAFEPLVKAYACLFSHLLDYIRQGRLSNVSRQGFAFEV